MRGGEELVVWRVEEVLQVEVGRDDPVRECVLFIGTRFSNLYTAVDTPSDRCVITSPGDVTVRID